MAPLPPQSFPASSRRLWPPVAVGAALLAAGARLVLTGQEPLVGWTAIASGAVLAGWFASSWWRRAPVVSIDAAGLRARQPGFASIAWRDVERLRLLTRHRRAYLAIDRTAAARAAEPRQPAQRAWARAAGAEDLALPLDGLAFAPQQVAAVAELAWRHANAPAV